MFKKFLLLLLIVSFSAKSQQSQYSVKGKLDPVSDYKWVILYQLKGANQAYIANTTLKEGSFDLNFPDNAEKGMYRLTYDLENSGFVDFLYNVENIELNFDPTFPSGTLKFQISNENKIYNEYVTKSEISQQKLDSLQIVYFRLQNDDEQIITADLFKNEVKDRNGLQKMYEELSKGRLANNFIKADRKFVSDSIFDSPQEYLNSIKAHYFDFIDFSDEALYNSTYFSDKIIDYVFYLNSSDDVEVQQQLFKLNVEDVLAKIGENTYIKSEIITILLHSFAQTENVELIEYLIEKHYLKLPKDFVKQKIIDEVRAKVKLAIGEKAPDFSWEEKGEKVWLSKLDIAKKYVIVFWSTTCSHCLTEVPQLYEFTKDSEDVHVIAFALENDEFGFNHYTKDFEKWTNILGLEKWQNKTAREYEINSTPTYFVLDADKNIIAKPDYFTDVKDFLEN